MLSLQDEIIGIEAIGALAFDALDLGEPQTRFDGADDGKRYLVLQGENIVGLAVIALGPDMRAGRGVDELPGDAHAIAGLAHAAFEHIAHAKLAADLLHVDSAALVGEGRITRDDEQPLD